MKACEACSALALMPLRVDVPRHLQRYSAQDLSFGFVRISVYECIRCQSLWCWHIDDGWECMNAPPPVVVPVRVSAFLGGQAA